MCSTCFVERVGTWDFPPLSSSLVCVSCLQLMYLGSGGSPHWCSNIISSIVVVCSILNVGIIRRSSRWYHLCEPDLLGGWHPMILWLAGPMWPLFLRPKVFGIMIWCTGLKCLNCQEHFFSHIPQTTCEIIMHMAGQQSFKARYSIQTHYSAFTVLTSFLVFLVC